MSTKLVPTFADRGCRVVSATDPHARILGFLDRLSQLLTAALLLHDVLSARLAWKTSFPVVLALVTLRGVTYSIVASLFTVP
jgi:hypothetical protein